MRTLLRKLGYVVTFDDDERELEDADILVDGAAVAAVGRDLPTDNVDQVVEGRGLIAVPGLINSHNHLWEGGLRCLPEIERAHLVKWRTTMGRYAMDAWRSGRFTPNAVATIGRAVLLESLLGGVTTVADQYYHFPGDEPQPFVEATAAAALEVGGRLQICRGSMTLGRSGGSAVDDDLVQTIDEVLRHCSELIETHHDPKPFARIRVAVAPCGLHADHPDVFRPTAELALDHPGVTLHTHLYCKADAELAQQLWGKTPWEIISQRGWANDRVWLAHVVDPPTHEIGEFAAAGVKVSHSPACDSRMGYGLSPIRDFLDAGVTVGISTSGSGSNDGANVLADLRVGVVGHRNLIADPEDWPPIRRWLRMATRGSAECMGRTDLGVIAPAYAADISCWRMEGVDRIGIHDPVAGLVMTGLSNRADLVMVNGEIAVRDGRATLVDEEIVAQEVAAVFPRTRHPNAVRWAASA